MKKIPLTQDKEAIVDDEDYPLISRHNWCAVKKGKNWYAETGVKAGRGAKKQQTLYMHHLILPQRNGYIIDHIDMNGLNNQRRNLRYALWGQNVNNSRPRRNRKFRGVYKQSYKRKTKRKTLGNPFYAAIRHNGKLIHIGSFKTEIEAAKAFNKKSMEIHGKHAFQNPIPKEEK